MAAEALEDLQIVDFSRVLAGPLATMVLADLGARVTKIERPGVGDETRGWGPPYDAAGMSTYFQSVNRNKQSIALDLHDELDLELAHELILDADVLVENFRPGLMESVGLGYDALRSAHPGLVYCSITGFGAETANAAALPGYDLLVQALGGLMSITGDPEGEPHKVGVALVDVICGLFASVGILAALRHRERTGEGQRVEVDLLSSLLAALVNQGSAYTLAGEAAGRMGNAHPSIAPYELLRTAEGELVLAVGNDRQFRALTVALDCVELADDERFSTNSARVANREQLRSELESRLRRTSAAQWALELSAVRVPAGEVNDIAGAFALAEALGLEPIVAAPAANGQLSQLTRNPIRMSATPPSYRSAAPEMPRGQDRPT
jgi:crotonobetainyl-CoA:carnitine CoA-transferase CaiB-like acyl-CoA transferase